MIRKHLVAIASKWTPERCVHFGKKPAGIEGRRREISLYTVANANRGPLYITL